MRKHPVTRQSDVKGVTTFINVVSETLPEGEVCLPAFTERLASSDVGRFVFEGYL
ncbi:hypothetical protein J4732_08355 [Serratia marcescens]|uniref:Uncharacterized protein n=1 Tax=Serratia marcescens TaxID=615 RepID=A0A939NLV8_SERMA|nr:hypothetical protein [Serratia marcescens]